MGWGGVRRGEVRLGGWGGMGWLEWGWVVVVVGGWWLVVGGGLWVVVGGGSGW